MCLCIKKLLALNENNEIHAFSSNLRTKYILDTLQETDQIERSLYQIECALLKLAQVE